MGQIARRAAEELIQSSRSDLAPLEQLEKTRRDFRRRVQDNLSRLPGFDPAEEVQHRNLEELTKELQGWGDLRTRTLTLPQAAVKPDPTTPKVVQYLNAVLGVKLVAVLTGVNDPTVVERWANGENAPDEAETKLRAAYKITRLIGRADSSEVARAWMVGVNHQLDDESPVMVIQEGRFDEVYIAARNFLNGG